MNRPTDASTPLPPAAVSRAEFEDLKSMFNDAIAALNDIKDDLGAEKDNLMSLSTKVEVLESEVIPGVKKIARSKKVG